MSFYFLEDIDWEKSRTPCNQKPASAADIAAQHKSYEFQKVFAAEEVIIGVSTRRI
ncbi:hypothetical protein ABFT80_15460 [Mesorhizobium sp. SB112]|uniref:hypothetical protein n=1 Tax=Mesorhizobium sp. SB112 TaxID=3151853 RepID=UPI003265B58B